MAGRRPGGARWARRAAILVAGLALFELGLRGILGNFGQSRVLVRSDDPEICLELRPGADVPYTGWLLRVAPTRMRINQLGGRGAEVGPKTSGTLRIATFGDSFTFGQGVEEDEAWPAAMATALAQDGPVEVLNFGVPGHGTPQSAALARKLAAEIQPDVVLVGVFTNDLSPAESYCDYGEGDSTLGRWMLQNVYATRLAWILTGPLRGGGSRGPDSPQDRFRDALRGLEAAGRDGDFLVGAVLLSDRDAYAAEPWCDGCTPPHDLIEGTGVQAIDMSATWPLLVDHRDRYFLRGEEHLTAAGNRLMGTDVAEALRGWSAFRALRRGGRG